MTERIKTYLNQGIATASICARQLFGTGIFRIAAENIVRLIQFTVFVLLWKGFARAGVDLGGFTESSLLTYTCISFALYKPLNIITPATASLWEGSIIGRYTRPMPPYLSFISETVGKGWIPTFICFTIPLLVISYLLGINIAPYSIFHGVMFIISLFLSVVIGFGFDILFASFALRLKNSVWMVTGIREAIFTLLSGALIPFSLMPEMAEKILSLLPFGSIASAPLNIFIGTDETVRFLLLQIFWAAAIWIMAHAAYKKSEERMVSYGG